MGRITNRRGARRAAGTLTLIGTLLIPMTGWTQQGKQPNVLDIHAKSDEHSSGFLEDPFVTKYRKKFFSVFSGNMSEFENGMKELDAMLAKNPDDARALVWHGNGLMVKAGLVKMTGKSDEAKHLLLDSKKAMDRAVSLAPENVNILAMRAVTLYIAGKYWSDDDLPPGSWQAVIDDLEKSRKIIGQERMRRLSIHARGEILSELATGYTHMKRLDKARALWNEVIRSVPKSKYAAQAEEQLKQLEHNTAAQSSRS